MERIYGGIEYRILGAIMIDKEYQDGIDSAVKALPEREQLILKLRFGFQLTLEQVGSIVGITRERVRQIEAKALEMVKSSLHDNGKMFERVIWANSPEPKRE